MAAAAPMRVLKVPKKKAAPGVAEAILRVISRAVKEHGREPRYVYCPVCTHTRVHWKEVDDEWVIFTCLGGCVKSAVGSLRRGRVY